MSIHNLPFVLNYLRFEEIDSTNTYAKSLSTWPDAGLVVIRADRQTAGRGQRGNTFFSSDGGLWVTVVTKPQSLDSHFVYNRALVLAITDSLLSLCPGAPVSVKWPNDVYWADRKICGLLLESAGPEPRYLVIGFGLNVNIPRQSFPPTISSLATSLLAETGKEFDLETLLSQILTQYRYWLSVAEHEAHALYLQRLYRKGEWVQAGDDQGRFVDVLADGRLHLESQHGPLYLTSGPLRFAHS